MTDPRFLLDAIGDTDRMLASLREAMPDPYDEIASINLESVRKRRNDLVRRLNQELHSTQGEYLEYSFERVGTDRYPALAVGESITKFQRLFTAIFDALRSKPKKDYRPSPDNVELSTLDFLAARPGSVVLSFSIPNDLLPIVESDAHRTMNTVASIVRARTSEEFRTLASEVGPSAITQAYNWISTATKFGTEVRLKWGQSFSDTNTLEISSSELEQVREILSVTGEQSTFFEDVEGLLVGYDGSSSYFHLELVDGRDLKGSLAEGFPLRQKWTLNEVYRARVVRIVTLKYSTGEEQERWFLEHLFSGPQLTK